jgi:hypothetical protein
LEKQGGPFRSYASGWVHGFAHPNTGSDHVAAARTELNGQEKYLAAHATDLAFQPRSSNLSTESSTTAATSGRRSSISRGKSCPSLAAIGQTWITQRENWY